MPKPPPNPHAKPGLVRCLGPGREHKFKSGDVLRERICKACREKMAGVGFSARDQPVRTWSE